ncbi:ubiquitin-conjugating enzyme E2 S, partial [Spiromyces aspiralis]
SHLSISATKAILKELAHLQRSPPEGIKVIPNEQDITKIYAYLLGPPGTPYEGGVFKVKLSLPDDFPNSPPKGSGVAAEVRHERCLMTKIFHPNISESGEICVNTLKKDWNKSLGLEHVLVTVKCLMIYPNPESALNEEAGKLLLEQYDEYFKHAAMLTKIHAQNRDNIEFPNLDQASNRSGRHPAAPNVNKEVERRPKLPIPASDEQKLHRQQPVAALRKATLKRDKKLYLRRL